MYRHRYGDNLIVFEYACPLETPSCQRYKYEDGSPFMGDPKDLKFFIPFEDHAFFSVGDIDKPCIKCGSHISEHELV